MSPAPSRENDGVSFERETFAWPAALWERVTRLRDDARFHALKRSIDVYYDDLARAARMHALLERFVGPNDLFFDIGSHVGDRIAVARDLGARVVACEPQPVCLEWLRGLFGDVGGVTIEGVAVGRAQGTTRFHLNEDNPTVSTAAADFLVAADGAEGWAEQRWTRTIDVPVTTLDQLIAKHGTPRFLKIDVEGFEVEALAGLSAPVPALSFEFTTIQKDVARRCIDRIADLGAYAFNVSLGESHVMTFDSAVDAAAMADHVTRLPMSANSGDVYAWRQT